MQTKKERSSSGECRNGSKWLTWVAGGGAPGTVDDGEGVFENGGEREGVVDAAALDLAVDGGESAGDGTTGGEVAVRYERWRHCYREGVIVKERETEREA